MSKHELSPLSFAELNEINQQTVFKAESLLGEARARLDVADYDLAVRHSQEAFELNLKSLFRLLQRGYPKSHDLKNEIYELAEALKEYPFDRRQVGRLALADTTLRQWRLPAFYGDERLNVGALFNEGEAKLAISYAESAQHVCGVVRYRAYERASAVAGT